MPQQRSEKLSCSEINGVLRSDKRMRVSGSGAYLQTGRAFVPAHEPQSWIGYFSCHAISPHGLLRENS